MVVCIALPPALGFENVFQLIGAWTDDIFLLNNVSSLEGNEIEADKKSVDIEEILGELNYSENIAFFRKWWYNDAYMTNTFLREIKKAQ